MRVHGHITPLPGGAKARCGGPAICRICKEEVALVSAAGSIEQIIEIVAGMVNHRFDHDTGTEYYATEDDQTLDILVQQAQAGLELLKKEALK